MGRERRVASSLRRLIANRPRCPRAGYRNSNARRTDETHGVSAYRRIRVSAARAAREGKMHSVRAERTAVTAVQAVPAYRRHVRRDRLS